MVLIMREKKKEYMHNAHILASRATQYLYKLLGEEEEGIKYDKDS